MTNGVAEFNKLQILDLAKIKTEFFVEHGQLIPVHLGKNATAIFKNHKHLLQYQKLVTLALETIFTGILSHWLIIITCY